MSIKLRYPVITISRTGVPQQIEPLRQIQSYMYQLVDELNVALENVESQASEAKELASSSTSTGVSSEKEAQSTFNSIKALIIKSADIVNAYYEKINARLVGEYVAQSDFGSYAELTEQQIEANSTSIKQFYANLQEIITDIESLEHTLIEVNAHIHSGLLYYDDAGVPVYGLEIGQRTEIDGEEVFNKYARFTADKLSFYDSNDNEVAYVSDKKLYITHVEVTGSYRIGGFVDTVLSDGSVVTKWLAIGGDS